MSGNQNNNALAFLAGAASGGLLALLLAPSSGKELRSQVATKADEVGSEIKRRAESAREKATALRDSSAAKLTELWEGGKGGAQARKDAILAAYHEGVAAYDRALRDE